MLMAKEVIDVLEPHETLIGYEGVNNEGAEFKVIASSNQKEGRKRLYVVEFKLSKNRILKPRPIILAGKFKDRYHPSIHGVGYIGGIDRASVLYPRHYSIWHKMLARCYNPNTKNYYLYGAKGMVVENRWHNLSNFIEDVPKIEGYREDLWNAGLLQIDKDMKQQQAETRIYSLDTCMFVTQEEHTRINMGMNYGIWD